MRATQLPVARQLSHEFWSHFAEEVGLQSILSSESIYVHHYSYLWYMIPYHDHTILYLIIHLLISGLVIVGRKALVLLGSWYIYHLVFVDNVREVNMARIDLKYILEFEDSYFILASMRCRQACLSQFQYWSSSTKMKTNTETGMLSYAVTLTYWPRRFTNRKQRQLFLMQMWMMLKIETGANADADGNVDAYSRIEE